ncbi:hypothetical protein K493DRAFT_314023 [Basidiobolus meristosporus CBS 931.73]|uniref:Uncharacterized protein n=1 Tax=Basidiobolus meristosporus CBS 931.73 TaxID=1314790 RepID=A0A1Y1YI19_9FUNG|nr:hypothetical protein K493DRAFT_314023 [Basidiobolus meristosporus CBS 931.73]|eukprot:ORX97578.1 hypothetical protein K493DRAFT_314023 [Basidiobolus meristosporus CBS 931.73]
MALPVTSDGYLDEAALGELSLHQEEIDSDLEVDVLEEETEDSEDDYDLEAEWEENMNQLKVLLTAFVLPIVARMAGRRFSFWIWRKVFE